MGVVRGAAAGAIVVGVVVGVVALGGAAFAKPEHGHGPVKLPPIAAATSPDDAHVDWARGLVIAGGVGIADRHAPSPAVARGTARRGAEEQARAALAAKLPQLPLATGGTLADRLADAATKARIDRAVADAITLDAEPETDGAWHVELAVPIDALRIALDPAGARVWPAAGDAGPAVVIVDGATTAVPALGWTIDVAGAPLPAALVFAKTVPASAASAPHVKAKSAKAGVLALADAAGATAATLVVVISK